MSEYTIRLVKEPTDAQVDEAVALSVKAFQGDPIITVLTGNNWNLADPFFRSIIRAGALAGAVYIATDKTDRILAVGVWFGPGQELYSTAEQHELGFNDLFAGLSPDTQEWWTKTYGPVLDKFLKEALGEKKLESWYANLIVTDPAWQRRGLATALVDAVYQRAISDKTVLALCAGNETNGIVYRKMGFEEKGRLDMSSSHGSFPTICLTKTPSE
ncbi:hypothetical protein EVG20_g4770 [Dentipellis fragilis]|uniref:N-acetyltransferase domain-containing protein n=1 Tax=Dentipellis fragilis TaxID=205917 RepID=A0A4Y9YV53_9AGAM|nr:hypothetical protein EVG20_g4770 [Dentipellis fragilis]